MSQEHGYYENHKWRNQQVEEERLRMKAATNPDDRAKLFAGGAIGAAAGVGLGLLSKGRSNKKFAEEVGKMRGPAATHMPIGDVINQSRRVAEQAKPESLLDMAVDSERVQLGGFGGAAAGVGVAGAGLGANKERAKHRDRMHSLRHMNNDEIEAERSGMGKRASEQEESVEGNKRRMAIGLGSGALLGAGSSLATTGITNAALNHGLGAMYDAADLSHVDLNHSNPHHGMPGNLRGAAGDMHAPRTTGFKKNFFTPGMRTAGAISGALSGAATIGTGAFFLNREKELRALRRDQADMQKSAAQLLSFFEK